jgi:hypothetical protein
MVNLNSFIPGLESFMEETEVSVNVSVSPEEQADAVVDQQTEVAEAEEAATETAEAEAGMDKAAAGAEMVFNKALEIDRMIAHVQRYGVDRSFLSLCNHDGILNRAFNLQLPSCESFDVVGNPNSIVSQEALEGLKNAAKAAGDWIKKMWDNFINWFTKLIGTFSKTAENVKDKLDDLQKAYDAKVKDGCALDMTDDPAKIIDVNKITKLQANASLEQIRDALSSEQALGNGDSSVFGDLMKDCRDRVKSFGTIYGLYEDTLARAKKNRDASANIDKEEAKTEFDNTKAEADKHRRNATVLKEIMQAEVKAMGVIIKHMKKQSKPADAGAKADAK